MEEIKVGEYVRDSEDKIYKVDENFKKHANVIVKKHSFKLMDLIEIGDIVKVNFYGDKMVAEVTKGYNNELSIDLADYQPPYINLKDVELISIVTKEQFENIEYKV